MSDLFYVIKFGSAFVSLFHDDILVPDFGAARTFSSIESAEKFLKLHSNSSLKICEVSIKEV